MGKYVEQVCQRAVMKRKELENDPAAPELSFEQMRIAEKFLSHKRAFAVSQPILSLAVLKFLGYTDKEINELYWQLVYEQSVGDQYTYVDPDRVAEHGAAEEAPAPTAEEEPAPDADDEADSAPDVEPVPMPEEKPRETVFQYYQCKTGEIFKATNGCNFQLLKDGEWIRCPGLMSYYYDAASDYWEINESYVNKILHTQK